MKLTLSLLFTSLLLCTVSGCMFGAEEATPVRNCAGLGVNTNTEMVAAAHADELSREDNECPNQFEISWLLSSDERTFFCGPQYDTRYDSTLKQLLKAAGSIIPPVVYRVVSDFRTVPCDWFGFGTGGMCGALRFIIDGKMLDMLYEYSTYLAGTADTSVKSRNDALSSIVVYHNSVAGPSPSRFYDRADLTIPQRAKADLIFRSLTGVVLFHEYGHYYFYHILDDLREDAKAIQDTTYVVEYTSRDEDQADYWAGLLSRRAGLDTTYGKQLIDIAAFYIYNQFVADVYNRIEMIEDNPQIQDEGSDRYSSNADRKRHYVEAFNAY